MSSMYFRGQFDSKRFTSKKFNNVILDILMNTNGELFTEENSIKILKSGLTRLMVSIDAHSSYTFSKIRVGGNYETVKKNTLRLIELREKMGLKLPLIRTSFVL